MIMTDMAETMDVATHQHIIVDPELFAGRAILEIKPMDATIRKGRPTSEMYHLRMFPRNSRECMKGISKRKYPTFKMVQTKAAPMAPSGADHPKE